MISIRDINLAWVRECTRMGEFMCVCESMVGRFVWNKDIWMKRWSHIINHSVYRFILHSTDQPPVSSLFSLSLTLEHKSREQQQWSAICTVSAVQRSLTTFTPQWLPETSCRDCIRCFCNRARNVALLLVRSRAGTLVTTPRLQRWRPVAVAVAPSGGPVGRLRDTPRVFFLRGIFLLFVCG